MLRPGNFSPQILILSHGLALIVLFLGPYINAETTAGGIAHWATSQVAGTLRTNATDFHDSWQDYIAGIINVTKPNQITEGGPVIGIVKLFNRKVVILTSLASEQLCKSVC